ncbi:MAG: hypothetical protein Q4G58_07750 [bacterium]|nr:hypothetical protein [bacterium]
MPIWSKENGQLDNAVETLQKGFYKAKDAQVYDWLLKYQKLQKEQSDMVQPTPKQTQRPTVKPTIKPVRNENVQAHKAYLTMLKDRIMRQ